MLGPAHLYSICPSAKPSSAKHQVPRLLLYISLEVSFAQLAKKQFRYLTSAGRPPAHAQQRHPLCPLQSPKLLLCFESSSCFLALYPVLGTIQDWLCLPVCVIRLRHRGSVDVLPWRRGKGWGTEVCMRGYQEADQYR